MSYKDDLVYHRGMMEGQKSRVVSTIVKDLEELLPQIYGLTAIATKENINKIVKDIQKIIDERFNTLTPEMQKMILELGYYEADYQQALLQSSLLSTSEVVIAGVGESVIKTAILNNPVQGSLLKDGLKNVNNDVKRSVELAVRSAVANGETSRQAQARVRGNYTISEKRMNNFLRTAIQTATNEATTLTYLENDIKKVQVVAVLDTRTTDFCKGIHGTILVLSKNPNLPPYHWNCRTFTVPVLTHKNEEEINSNFAKWLEQDGNKDLTANDKGNFVESSKTLITLENLKNKEEKRLGEQIG